MEDKENQIKKRFEQALVAGVRTECMKSSSSSSAEEAIANEQESLESERREVEMEMEKENDEDGARMHMHDDGSQIPQAKATIENSKNLTVRIGHLTEKLEAFAEDKVKMLTMFNQLMGMNKNIKEKNEKLKLSGELPAGTTAEEIAKEAKERDDARKEFEEILVKLVDAEAKRSENVAKAEKAKRELAGMQKTVAHMEKELMELKQKKGGILPTPTGNGTPTHNTETEIDITNIE